MKRYPVCFLAIAAMCLYLLSGCLGKTQPPRFYSLSSMDKEKIDAEGESAARNAVIGIGPINLPAYLEQLKIVTRAGENQLARAEYDEWAGALKDNFTNVLAENIGFLAPSERIYLYPWRRSVPVEYQVVVDIIGFEGRLGESAWLIARWSLFDVEKKTLLKAGRSSVREPVESGDYASLVAAQSRALEKFSREIVDAIHVSSQGG